MQMWGINVLREGPSRKAMRYLSLIVQSEIPSCPPSSGESTSNSILVSTAVPILFVPFLFNACVTIEIIAKCFAVGIMESSGELLESENG